VTGAPDPTADLLAALPIGVACLDDEPRVLWANALFVSATGVEPGARLGSSERCLPGLESAAREVIASGACAEVEILDGLMARLSPLPGRRVAVVVIEAADRAALEASERRFEAFMDHSPAISFMTDECDRAVYLSRPYLETFGLGPEMIGRSAWELLPEEFVAQYLERINRVRETGEVVTEVLPAPREDGVGYWQTQYFPIPRTPGRLVGGVSSDVTEIVRAREELHGRAQEQAALRRVATLVARWAPDELVFRAVSEEVGRLLVASAATLLRFTGEARAVVLGAWSEPGVPSLPIGTELDVDPQGVLAKIRDTRAPFRIDDYETAAGAFVGLIRSRGLKSSVAAPIVVGESLWGAVVASTAGVAPMPALSEQRLGSFAELVSQALANSESHRELRASRARIVEAQDAERRRLGRDLHDGAQQRLVSLLIQLGLVREKAVREPEAALDVLDQALENAQAAVEELRQLAAGIHPAVLSQRGLSAALESLASRSLVPVELRVALPARLPLGVETAAYFVVAEALTNVAKYARASHVEVDVRQEGDSVAVEVRDDGVGGAEMNAGTGLSGLDDRVGALDGTVELHSPPGAGTILTARMPVRG